MGSQGPSHPQVDYTLRTAGLEELSCGNEFPKGSQEQACTWFEYKVQGLAGVPL